MHRRLLLAGMVMWLSACTATTMFHAEQPNLRLRINQDPAIDVRQPVPHTYKTTSFGQYMFELKGSGNHAMYGLLPLRFNGGYIAPDLLFFAPAMFFNLREVFPNYEFDIKKGILRYKDKGANKWWVTYKPTPAEEERARRYFHALDDSKDGNLPARTRAGQ